MTSVDPSQQDGINPEAEANADDQNSNANDDATHNDESWKGVKKLLTQRNEARSEADKWEAKYNEAISTTVDSKLAERDRAAERQNFKAQFGEEKLQEIDAVLEKHPSLSMEEAFKIANPQEFASMWQSFNVQGTVPSSLHKTKTASDMSVQELRESAKAEFQKSIA